MIDTTLPRTRYARKPRPALTQEQIECGARLIAFIKAQETANEAYDRALEYTGKPEIASAEYTNAMTIYYAENVNIYNGEATR